ncbi:MAG TPA: hypothetical protein VFT39_10145 [Vicinamibacterales bacterium]|nr:hypothetical protein [Vicinamibacterales bacterium]
MDDNDDFLRGFSLLIPPCPSPTSAACRHQSLQAEYRQGRKLATVNRALGVLRAAVNWGRFQDPPLLPTTPFHRFGVTIKARDETKRDRRIHRDEEQRLLAACVTMNSPEHTAWESLLLIAYGHETKRVRPGARVDRDKLQRIDLHWHDLRTRVPAGCWPMASTSASSS